MDHRDRAVILDGITVQHVGELLFQSGTTAAVRKLCRGTYLRSLEDFAFGFLFGEKLALSGRMAPVGDDTPGATLIQQKALKEILVPVEMPDPTTIEETLKETGFRLLVGQDILAVNQLGDNRLELFRHFFVREAMAYLGNHPSLHETDLNPSDYVFEAPHPSHYVVDRELENYVSQKFVNCMITAMRNRAAVTVSDASNEALTEFVSRVLLTHVANYWAFDHAVERQPHGSVRLPHVTRAAIRSTINDMLDQPGNLEKEVRLKRLIYNCVVPRALLSVISIARSRDQFLDALREKREDKRFISIREYLTDLAVQLGAGDNRNAERLIREIDKMSESGSHEPEPLTLNLLGIISIGIPGNALVDCFSRLWNPGKYYLRELFGKSAYSDEADYQKRLSQIFPEFADDK